MNQQSIIQKSILTGIIIVCFIGFRFWSGYEQARGRDIMTVASLYEASHTLDRFYGEHSAYPVQMPSIVNNSSALTYVPLSEDAKSPCASKNVCPHYAIEFALTTNSLLPKGKHTYTDEGLK